MVGEARIADATVATNADTVGALPVIVETI